MRLFDSHCHFEGVDSERIGAVLSRARTAGVERIMAVGGSPALNRSALAARDYAAAHPDVAPAVTVALGYDRDQLGADLPPIAATSPPDAWGEIGLDYHYSPETRAAQLTHFAEQLEEAKRRNLAVIIHTREADEDTLGVLREIPSRGVIHCFTGTPPFAKRLLDEGFYISISGIVTFRAADNVRESVRMVPDDRLMIETDSPYLAPVPMRGQANEPAWVAYTCRFLAELRKMPADTLAALTFANGERAFA